MGLVVQRKHEQRDTRCLWKNRLANQWNGINHSETSFRMYDNLMCDKGGTFY